MAYRVPCSSSLVFSLLLACGASGARPLAARPPLSASAAVAIAMDAENRLAEATPASPLDDPQTLEDALAVLRADRIDLFSAAIDSSKRLAEASTEPEARFIAESMATQLELAWGEAEVLVADILERAARAIETELGRVAPHRGVGSERARLERENAEVREALFDAQNLAEGLRRSGTRRIHDEYGRVQRYLEGHEANYLAHRIAADFYRLVGDWGRFQTHMTRLTELRPNSTGLKFLRGAAAAQQGNPVEALPHLEGALADDDAFTRARVYRLLVQRDLPSIQRELAALEASSPYHQIVYWAGPLVAQGYVAL